MKKLMMAAAIVCAAVFANAAEIHWNCAGLFYYGGSDAAGGELAGSTIYAFDGSLYSSATILSALSTTGLTALDGAIGSGTVNSWDEYDFAYSDAAGSKTTKITYDGTDTPPYIDAFLVAVTKDGKFATAFDLDPIEVNDGVLADGAPLGAEWAMETKPGAGSAGWTTVASVPEPTSGLLLLLGMAGLALRRRRA